MASVADSQASMLPYEGKDIVLDFQQIEKSFRRAGRPFQALHHVSFRARQGHITGLIGPDGAGKTTLMRLAAGLLLPDSGRVTILDWDTQTDPLSVQSSISYMPQQFGLYEDLTVSENLDLYADLQGEPKSSRPDRFRQTNENDWSRPVPCPACGASLRWNETKARAGLYASTHTAAAATGRTDSRC